MGLFSQTPGAPPGGGGGGARDAAPPRAPAPAPAGRGASPESIDIIHNLFTIYLYIIYKDPLAFFQRGWYNRVRIEKEVLCSMMNSISILRALDVDDLIFGGSMEQPISDR